MKHLLLSQKYFRSTKLWDSLFPGNPKQLQPGLESLPHDSYCKCPRLLSSVTIPGVLVFTHIICIRIPTTQPLRLVTTVFPSSPKEDKLLKNLVCCQKTSIYLGLEPVPAHAQCLYMWLLCDTWKVRMISYKISSTSKRTLNWNFHVETA